MDTLESVLAAHQDVFDAAKANLAGLPEKRGGLPLTFTEATAYIQHKEDEKRRREAKKDRQKQRSGPQLAETVPGLIPGPPDTSPFWLVTEGYFRDVTQEDVAALLPTFANPLEDPILRVPPIGRHYSSHNDFELAAFPPSALQRSSRPPAHAPLLKDRVSELKAQAAAEAVPVRDSEAGTPGESSSMAMDDTQRKSRRLVAKAEKHAEAGQFEDEHAPSSNGQLGTSCLLQSCSAEDVALLTCQAVALFSSSLDQAALEIGLQAAELEQAIAPQAASGDPVPLGEDLCSALKPWLRRKALEVLPQRAPLPSSQPSLETDEEVPERGKLEGSSQGLGTVPEPQSNAEQHGRPEAAVGSKLGDQFDQSAEGTAAGEAQPSSGQSHDQLQRVVLLDAGVTSDGPPAADDLGVPLQSVLDHPEMPAEALALSNQPTLFPPYTLAPAGEGDSAEPSQPAVGDALTGAGEAAPSEPARADGGAVQLDASSDARMESVPGALAPVAKQESSEPADGQASLVGPPTEQQPSKEAGTGQLALQAGNELPSSSAPAVSAPKAGKQPAESGEAALSCLPCSVTSMTPDQAAKLGTWAAWQEALRAAPAAAQAAAADDEAMHPYTRRLLACPPSQYVLQPERLDENRGGMPLSGINTPTGVTPSVSGEDSSAFAASRDRADGDVQSAHTPRHPFSFAALPSHLGTGAELTAAHDAPALGASVSGMEAGHTPKEEQLKTEPTEGFHGDATQMAERAASGSLTGPSHSHGAPHTGAWQSGGAAGSKRPGEPGSRGPKRGQAKGGPERGEARQRGHTALAVQGAIAAGPHEGSTEQQWEQLGSHGPDLAAAPDDEVLAEILAVQAELLQQVAVNRSRLRGVVDAMLQDMPAQREAAKLREEGIEFARQYHNRLKALKRGAKREKREAAARDALKEAQAAMPTSPRQAANRARGATPTRIWQGEMVDVLASRKGEEEALCAICADGTSVEPNVIVFCERCDMAVHQLCYGIEQIPSGEWLCWPCRLHEEGLQDAGVPQKEIRPPRWEMHASMEGRRVLEGGSLAAECQLCPIRQGAFRHTVDTHEWVHQVCAMWTPDVRVRRGPDLEVVEGVSGIPPERWGALCSVCGSARGVVLRCSAGHCTLPFHTLCGRNAGFHLAARGEPGQKTTYRAYCALHSEAQRRKDLELAAEGGALKRKDGKRVAKEEAAQQAALRALANREAHWDTLERARLELESLRMLLERVGRREKVKKQLTLSTWEAMKLRAANPLPGWQACLEAEALPPISARLAARQGQPPGSAAAQQVLPAQQPPSAFSGAAQAPAFGHASSAPKTVPGRHLNLDDKQGTGSLLHLPGLSTLLNGGLLGPSRSSMQEPLDPLPLDSSSLPPLLDAGAQLAPFTELQLPLEPSSGVAAQDVAKDGQRGDQAGVGGSQLQGTDAAMSKAAPAKTAPKRKRNSTTAEPQKGKRAKKAEATAAEAEEVPASLPESSPGTRSRSLRSSGDQVDRNCLMTSSEAAAANSRMPKGFKYVPVQPPRKSSRPGSSKGGRS